MAIHWGVDSYNRADAKVQGTGGKTLFDHVVDKFKNHPARKNKKSPDFWGRYIGAANPLTKQEAQFLLQKDCRILVIYNKPGVLNNKTKKPVGTRTDGENAANDAIAAAKKLKIPGKIFLYANIEHWMRPSKDWILGWCLTMYRSQYAGAGGFYCNTWDLSHFSIEYKKALKKETTPKILPHHCQLYAQGPHKSGCQGIPSNYTPQQMTGQPQPAVWQYAINCEKQKVGGKEIGLYDLDLANDSGFNRMWKP